jgi:hypothetical protein
MLKRGGSITSFLASVKSFDHLPGNRGKGGAIEGRTGTVASYGAPWRMNGHNPRATRAP